MTPCLQSDGDVIDCCNARFDSWSVILFHVSVFFDGLILGLIVLQR